MVKSERGKSQSIDPHVTFSERPQETVVVEPETDGEVKADETDPVEEVQAKFNQLKAEGKEDEAVVLSKQCKWFEYKIRRGLIPPEIFGYDAPKPPAFAYVTEIVVGGDLKVKGKDLDGAGEIKKKIQEVGHYADGSALAVTTPPGIPKKPLYTESINEIEMRTFDQCTCCKSADPGRYPFPVNSNVTKDEFIEKILDHTVEEVQAKFNQLKAEGREDEAVVLSKQCKWFELKIRRGLIPLEIFGYDEPKPPDGSTLATTQEEVDAN